MPRKVLLGNEPTPVHSIDEYGKNHYGIRNMPRFRYDYYVKSVRAEHRRGTGDDKGEYLFFNVQLYDQNDLGLIVPIQIIGPFMRHMMELGSNFQFNRGLIVPTS